MNMESTSKTPAPSASEAAAATPVGTAQNPVPVNLNQAFFQQPPPGWPGGAYYPYAIMPPLMGTGGSRAPSPNTISQVSPKHQVVQGTNQLAVESTMETAKKSTEPPKKTGKKKQANTKKKKPPTQPTKKLAKGGGSAAYKKNEIDILLDAIKKNVPIGQIAWQTVMHYFNARVPPDRERDERSLRNKFNAMVNMKAPTGDPNIPNNILRAKQLSEKIIEHSEMVDGSNMSDESGEIAASDEEEEEPVNTDAITNHSMKPAASTN
jgi:hypothetical protein